MQKLSILFSKDSLEWNNGKEAGLFRQEPQEQQESFAPQINENIFPLAKSKKTTSLEIISAYNHFAIVPFGFHHHELGFDLLTANSKANPDTEELMLVMNKKHQVQFYYSFPKDYYRVVKEMHSNVVFTFSGDKFLNKIKQSSFKHQMHVHLYENQVEFFAIENKSILLYNNLDANSHVDFLYFILFTVSKIGWTIEDTKFFLYGQLQTQETFVSELKKFASHVEVAQKNKEGKNLLLF